MAEVKANADKQEAEVSKETELIKEDKRVTEEALQLAKPLVDAA